MTFHDYLISIIYSFGNNKMYISIVYHNFTTLTVEGFFQSYYILDMIMLILLLLLTKLFMHLTNYGIEEVVVHSRPSMTPLRIVACFGVYYSIICLCYFFKFFFRCFIIRILIRMIFHC